MTIAGQHSLEEAINLLETKQAQIAATDKGYQANKVKIDAKDLTFAGDWASFFNSWRAFYVSKRTKLALMSKLAPVTPNAVLPAESDYVDIVDAVKPFADFTRRIGAAGVTFDVKVGQLPETDVDLSTYKKADSATKAMEKSALPIAGIALSVGLTYLWMKSREK